MENLDKLPDKRTNNAGYYPRYLFYETAIHIVLPLLSKIPCFREYFFLEHFMLLNSLLFCWN